MRTNSKIIFLFLVICSLTPAYAETKVGILLGLSGVSADAGVDCMRGVGLARSLDPVSKMEKDGLIKYIVEDNRSEPRIAVDAFRKLVDVDKVSVVQLARSPIGMAVNPISKLKKIPIVGTIGHQDFATQNEYAYQFWPTTLYEGSFLAENILKENYKTLAVLYTEDEWTKTLSEGLKKRYVDGGGKLVFYESILPIEADVLGVLTKIRSLKPEAVVFNHTLGELSLVLRKSNELAVGGQKFSNYWAGFKSVMNTVGEAKMEGVRFVEVDIRYAKFQTSFKEMYKEEFTPSAITFTCYLSTLAVGQAVKECAGTDINRCLKNMSAINAPDGPVSIMDRRVQYPLAIKVVKGGKIEVKE